MFIQLLWTQPEFYLSWLVLVVFSICVHEASHAWFAYTQGDTTAVDLGYLTLNPIKVMGRWSLAFVVLLGFAWGAVPVNPSRFKRASSHAIVAFSGPLANLVLAGLFAALLVLTPRIAGGVETEASAVIDFFLLIGLQVNVFLALFNLLPIPILDGWEIARLLVPPLRRVSGQKAQQTGFVMLLVILFSGMHYHIWHVARSVADTVSLWASGG